MSISTAFQRGFFERSILARSPCRRAGRRDTLRVRMFLEQGAVGLDELTDVVRRYGLAERLARLKD